VHKASDILTVKQLSYLVAVSMH